MTAWQQLRPIIAIMSNWKLIKLMFKMSFKTLFFFVLSFVEAVVLQCVIISS